MSQELSNLLKMYRVSSGVTTREMAKRVGVSQPAIYYFENGHREPSHISLGEYVKVYADAHDFSYSDVVKEVEGLVNTSKYKSTCDYLDLRVTVSDFNRVDLEYLLERTTSVYYKGKEVREDVLEAILKLVEITN